jgi:hypothetical protein
MSALRHGWWRGVAALWIALAAPGLAGRGLAQVAGPTGPKPPARTPQAPAVRPETALLQALHADPLTAPFRVRLDVVDGHYVLSGRVGSTRAHDAVIRAALAQGLVARDDLVIDTTEANRAAAEGRWNGSPVPSAPPQPLYVYPPPLMGRLDDPFYGFEPPLVSYPPWWRAVAARAPLDLALLNAASHPAGDQKALATPAPPPDAPHYQYHTVPQVRPGSVLYTYGSATSSGGDLTPIADNLFTFRELRKCLNAGDQAGMEELTGWFGGVFSVERGTAVKILEYQSDEFTQVPCYEVRVLEGPHAKERGWTFSSFLRGRNAVQAGPSGIDPARRVAPGTVELTLDTAGVATLRGVVPSLAQRIEIGQKVMKTPGITQVINLLEVDPKAPPLDDTPPAAPRPAGRAGEVSKPPPPPTPEPPPARADQRPITLGPSPADGDDLSRRVCQALGRRPALATLPLHVATRDGVVTLNGRVPSAYEAMLAYRAAEQTPGVREVNDRLAFDPPDLDRPNPLRDKARPEDLEPYLLAQVRRQVAQLAHVDRLRVQGDTLEIRGTVARADDVPRVEAAVRSIPILRGFRLEPRFLAE